MGKQLHGHATMDDKSYYHRRAEAELQMAERSSAPAAVKAHYLLAGYYLDRVFGGSDEQAAREDQRR